MKFSGLLALASLAIATPMELVERASNCPASTRQAGAEKVVQAYAATVPGQTYQIFHSIPFGVPNLAGACTTVIIPNGSGCLIPVGTTGNGVVQFGVETRQVFSKVTGEYVNFDNGTTLINTRTTTLTHVSYALFCGQAADEAFSDVTLGVRNIVPIPVTFRGYVFLDYNDDCRIYAVRAYAQVPTQVLNASLIAVGAPLPPCQVLPV